ncbi:Uncharacterised protein [Bordetella pertussis]|nr:Uncharacterised protein [Bordetella pertussis]
MRLQRMQAVQGEDAPLVFLAFPVQWRAPVLLAGLVPAERQPELGAAIAAVLDEGQVFSLGDGAVGQVKRSEQYLVRRGFVVEGKAFTGVADAHDAAVIAGPARRRAGRHAGGLDPL